MNFKNIPQELKNRGLFCVWKLTDKGKVPFDPVGKGFARSNDKRTFHSYAAILNYVGEYYSKNASGEQVGGLGLGIFNGYSAVDIDGCVNDEGELSELAKDIVDHIDSYTELSPSKTGIRIIFKTDSRINTDTHYINNRANGLEIYISDNTNKYVTLTGDVLREEPIRKVDLGYVLEKYMKKERGYIAPSNPVAGEGTPPGQRVEKALVYNLAFRKAWLKTASGSGGTESEDDLSLCNYLARILEGDFYEVDKAFMQSPYYASKDAEHKAKWGNDLYKQLTIKTAINSYHALKTQDNVEFEYTDTGNARRFVQNFKDVVRYNVDNKRWMVWNGEYWQTDMVGDVKNRVEVVAEQLKMEALNSSGDIRKIMTSNIKRVLSSFGKEAVLKESQHLFPMPVTNATFDSQKYLLNTKSGVVNLKTGEVGDHDKHLALSKYIGYEVSNEKPVRWLQFLREIYEPYPELIPYMQQLIGYWLTGETTEQAMYIFLGDGSNGKSLLLDVLLKMAGEYSTTTQSELLVDGKYSSGSDMPRLAALEGRRIVMVEETELGARLKESAIKNLTSDYGEITARYLYGNEFNYEPIFKLVMATNHRPIIKGTDHGIWRRMKIIPHDVMIPEEKQDRSLGAKLEKEIPQILGWAIQGAIKYYKEGRINEPNIIRAQVKDYRNEMDLVRRWVLENCEESPEFTESAADLFRDLSNYVEENKEYKMSMTIFGRNMGKKYRKRKINNRTHYIGIRLRREELTESVMKSGGDFTDV